MTSDLARLQREVKSDTAFEGDTELAKMSKARGLTNARASLADLCAIMLKTHLPKDSSIRVSESWEDTALSSAQINYAALDAWASLKVYEALCAIPCPGDIKADAAPGTLVSVLQDDRSAIIAHGHIAYTSREERQQVRHCNVTKTRCVVTVTEVCVWGAKLSLHRNITLQQIGPPPFDIVCSQRLVQSRYELPLMPSEPPDGITTPVSAQSQAEPDLDGARRTMSIDTPPTEELSAESEYDNLAAIPIAADAPLTNPTEETSAVKTAQADEAAIKLCEEIMQDFQHNDPNWGYGLASRVLKDPWHLMDMIRVSKVHGLRTAFARAYRDALFIPDDSDRKRLSAFFVSQGSSWDEMVRLKATYVWKRCKRVIPPPHILLPLVAEVFKTYGPLKDAKTQEPLFNKPAWLMVRNVLRTIELGYVSDPAGIALYTAYGIDKNGLTLYRCARGTNATEGGVHRPIRAAMPKSGAGPRHAKMRLLDFAIKHNLHVCCRPRQNTTKPLT